MNLIISDLDNTLGQDEASIAAGIQLLTRYQNSADICLITGRSLTSLKAFETSIPENAFLSPWGGGNILRKAGSEQYLVLNPFNVLNNNGYAQDVRRIYIPDHPYIAFTDEIVTGLGKPQPNDDYLLAGAYRQAGFDSQSGELNKGQNGIYYKLFTPYNLPRVALVNRLRDSYDRIIYIGDDYGDAACLSHVDFFLAPAGSHAAEKTTAVIYENLADLSILLTALLQLKQ